MIAATLLRCIQRTLSRSRRGSLQCSVILCFRQFLTIMSPARVGWCVKRVVAVESLGVSSVQTALMGLG